MKAVDQFSLSKNTRHWLLSITFAFALLIPLFLTNGAKAAGTSSTLQEEGEIPQPPFTGTILDDQSPAFQLTGPSEYWNQAGNGYEGHLWWTLNNNDGIENYARWMIEVPTAGDYNLYVYIPHEHATTTQAQYSITHALGNDSVWVNQATRQGSWFQLGTYTLSTTTENYIQLVDETKETDGKFEIAFDAVGYVFASDDVPLLPDLPAIENEWVNRIWDDLQQRIEPWLDQQKVKLEEQMDAWVEQQKSRLLHEIQEGINQWLENQCMSGSAALALPLAAIAYQQHKRRKN